MSTPAEIILHEEASAVDARLSTLGVSRGDLRESLLDGEVARDACTINDPPIAIGIIVWSRIVRGLRDRLVPNGWIRSDERNYATVVSSNGLVAIAVAAGDENTGKRGPSPGTRHAKGPVTVEVIERNQLELPFPGWNAEIRRIPEGGPITWILLVQRTGDCIFAELSLPASISEDGKRIAWAERILLGEIPTGREPLVESGPGPVIDIAIERRTG